MNNNIESVLVSEEQIKNRVKEMGKEITKDYEGKDLILVSVLKGSVVFMSDIMREINLPFEIDFMITSSYGKGTDSRGDVKILKDLDVNIKGKDVLIIEDIIDSGYTLSKLKNLLIAREPNSIKICTMLDKPSRRYEGIDLKGDYTGFEVPDEFVVGYGLDYAELYRGLPYVGVLKRSVYEK